MHAWCSVATRCIDSPRCRGRGSWWRRRRGRRRSETVAAAGDAAPSSRAGRSETATCPSRRWSSPCGFFPSSLVLSSSLACTRTLVPSLKAKVTQNQRSIERVQIRARMWSWEILTVAIRRRRVEERKEEDDGDGSELHGRCKQRERILRKTQIERERPEEQGKGFGATLRYVIGFNPAFFGYGRMEW